MNGYLRPKAPLLGYIRPALANRLKDDDNDMVMMIVKILIVRIMLMMVTIVALIPHEICSGFMMWPIHMGWVVIHFWTGKQQNLIACFVQCFYLNNFHFYH